MSLSQAIPVDKIRYNEKGLISKIVLPDSNTEKEVLWKYDNHGNWIEKKLQAKGKTLSLVRREISYYE